LPKRIEIIKLYNSIDLTKIVFENNTIIIDAIFGIGLNKEVEGIVNEAIQFVNNQNKLCIAIDVPSGLQCEVSTKDTDVIVLATYTLTFQVPKLSFMYPENAIYTGTFSVLDIGLSKLFLNDSESNYYFTTMLDVLPMFKKRTSIGSKWTYGHALLITGSYGKMGASLLSAKACMRAGVGLLTVQIPKCGYDSMQTYLPEAMVVVDDEQQFISNKINYSKYNAVGIGCGIGTVQTTANCLKWLIQEAKQPIVLDADAINILSENKTWLAFLPKGSILTPHYKEFERLVGIASSSKESYELQKSFAVKNGVYLILKAPHTSIATPEGYLLFNSTGNAGMATAGSGDVLTGIITALLAQGYTPFAASVLGVYLHGLAGDFAAQQFSQEAMMASDIIECLPQAFNLLHTSIE
jgi:NAD(P)H-hydrate epimerase